MSKSKSKEFVKGYISAVLEGRCLKSIKTDYGFGSRGLGLYVWRRDKILCFIPDEDEDIKGGTMTDISEYGDT